jgi:hypothetical protein
VSETEWRRSIVGVGRQMEMTFVARRQRAAGQARPRGVRAGQERRVCSSPRSPHLPYSTGTGTTGTDTTGTDTLASTLED